MPGYVRCQLHGGVQADTREPSVYVHYPAVDPRMPVVVPVPERDADGRDRWIFLTFGRAVSFVLAVAFFVSMLRRTLIHVESTRGVNSSFGTPLLPLLPSAQTTEYWPEVWWVTRMFVMVAATSFGVFLGCMIIEMGREALRLVEHLARTFGLWPQQRLG